MLGVPKARLIGRKCHEVFHGSDEPWKHCPHVRTLRTGKAAVEEFFEPRLKLYLHISCSPIIGRNGRLMGTLHVTRDITSVRRAAEELQRAQREELRVGFAALDTIPVAVLAVDTRGDNAEIIYANRAFEDMTGYTRPEVVGRDPSFLRGPASSPVPIGKIDESLAGQAVIQTEIPFYRKDGTQFWGLLHVAPVRNADGRLTHVIETLVDTTQMRRAEMEFEHQREELLLTTRAAKLGELASSIAHEVNQPLTAILSNAQAAQRLLAMDSPDVAEVDEILKDIVHDDRRAGEVIRKLRSMYKKKEPELELLDVNKLIRATTEFVNADAVMRNKVIRLDLDESVAPVRGDWVQLQQVLLNLISNGLDAMVESGPDAKELLIRSAPEGRDLVMIEVSDSGDGIPEQNMKRLFRHFFTTKPDGMGMGLPISRAIIEGHGGNLVVRNNPNKGATFFFTLPVWRKASQADGGLA